VTGRQLRATYLKRPREFPRVWAWRVFRRRDRRPPLSTGRVKSRRKNAYDRADENFSRFLLLIDLRPRKQAKTSSV
jgi:hypothetical protein